MEKRVSFSLETNKGRQPYTAYTKEGTDAQRRFGKHGPTLEKRVGACRETRLVGFVLMLFQPDAPGFHCFRAAVFYGALGFPLLVYFGSAALYIHASEEVAVRLVLFAKMFQICSPML